MFVENPVRRGVKNDLLHFSKLYRGNIHLVAAQFNLIF